MMYVLVDLKIVLALIPKAVKSDQNIGLSEGDAYPREGR